MNLTLSDIHKEQQLITKVNIIGLIKRDSITVNTIILISSFETLIICFCGVLLRQELAELTDGASLPIYMSLNSQICKYPGSLL